MKSYEYFGGLHGVRFRLGRNPFFALHFLPDSVLGPVDNPPCNLHLPDRKRSRRLHGVPALVLAPQINFLITVTIIRQ